VLELSVNTARGVFNDQQESSAAHHPQSSDNQAACRYLGRPLVS
jgi:hypothetical protein